MNKKQKQLVRSKRDCKKKDDRPEYFDYVTQFRSLAIFLLQQL